MTLFKNIDLNKIIIKPTKVTYLKMSENPRFNLKITEGVQFEKLEKPIFVDQYRTYYYNVGFKWHWLDRLVMDDDILFNKINKENVEIYVLKINGQAAGYAEFEKEMDYIEVVYFGLYPDFVGKGYGKFFLKWVINHAWSYNPKWIQLNTCELDHENALSVYMSQGFEKLNEKIEDRRVYLN